MKFLILLTLSLTLLSCGSKKKDKNLSNIMPNPGQESSYNDFAPKSNTPEARRPVQNESNDEFSYSIEASEIDMKRVKAGETVYMKCSTLPSVKMFNRCSLGFNDKDLMEQESYLTASESTDLYHIIQQPALKDKMMKGYKLAFNCKETCTLLKTVD